jgi:hypothetical protein
VVVDDRGPVLLFRHLDRTGKAFWATPGWGTDELVFPTDLAERVRRHLGGS